MPSEGRRLCEFGSFRMARQLVRSTPMGELFPVAPKTST